MSILQKHSGQTYTISTSSLKIKRVNKLAQILEVNLALLQHKLTLTELCQLGALFELTLTV